MPWSSKSMDGERSKLKALSDIASIDITPEFNQILQNILEITCKEMDAHSGTVMLVDEATGELRMVASYGLPEDYPEGIHEIAREAGVLLTSSPSGTALQTGHCYLVPDILEEPRARPWYDISREFGFSSQMFTPMKRGTNVIGLLNVHMAEPHRFTDEEIDFVTVAASQAASAVQNARICSRLKNNVLELKNYKEHLEDKIREAHRELYDSEKYLRTIIESSPDSIAVIDEQGRFEFGNGSFFNIIGWPREEMIGQSFTKMLTDDAKEDYTKIWREYQNRVPVNVKVAEAKIKTKNGEVRYLNKARTATVINGQQKYIFFARDISDKKNLELALKESEARYRDLFENAEDPMYAHDLRGYLLTVNRAGLKILGGTEEEVIGSHISKWLTPESYRLSEERVKKIYSGEPLEEPVTIEVVCKNGEHKWGEVRTRLMKDGDSITGVHGVARDITEKRRLEQQLKEYQRKLEKSNDELIEADRIKTEFISNITHELLTPLTSIKGFSELLHDQTAGKINSEQKRNLEIILRNSDRLIHLIRDLLDVAHLEKKQFGLQFGLVSVEDVISKCIQDLHPQVKDKQITIVLDLAPLPRIWGDEERLTQVIINLLNNAMKFTPEKGTVTVTARESENEVKISVKDTGIGISSEKLSRIFDRFYQVDGSVHRKYGGIGLGLTICKSIIENHYGSIWAESDGRGSTFYILLPKLADSKGPGL